MKPVPHRVTFSPYGLVALVVGIAMLITNAWHILTQWRANPNGALFAGIAHYFQDYFLYTSYIAQGVDGRLVFVNHMFTNEPLAPFWYYWIYVLLGKIGSIITANPFVIYNTSLVLFVVGTLYTLYVLCDRIFTKQLAKIIGFIFAVTASNFVAIAALFDGTFAPLVGMSWFSPTPALNRLGGVPHQSMQTALLLIIMLMASKLYKEKSQKKIFYATLALISFICATSNPVQLVLLIGALYTVVAILYKQTKHHPILGISLWVTLPAGLGILLANHEVSRQVIFDGARAWEQQQNFTVSLFEAIKSLGPILFLIPFGIRPYLKNLTPLTLILSLYGLGAFISFISPVPDILGVARVRWLHPASYVFFPILATYGYMEVIGLARSLKMNKTILAALVLSLYILTTIPALGAQIDSRNNTNTNTYLTSHLNHIPADYIQTLTKLRTLPENTVVIADPTLDIDLLIPVLSTKPSFSGHMLHTLYINEKNRLREKYFAGDMTTNEAKTFLTNHRIGFIIQAKNRTLPPESYRARVYENDTMTLEKVSL